MVGGVGTPNNKCKMLKRRIGNVVDAEEGIEGASFAFMGELNVGNVVGDGVLGLGFGEYLVGGHIAELGIGIDEAADEPRTRDPINLGPLASNPFVDVHRKLSAGGKSLCHPGGKAAVKIVRVLAKAA